MRHALALVLLSGTALGLMWVECREARQEVARYRRELGDMAITRIDGSVEVQRLAATVLAARARLAITELRRCMADREIGEHCRTMLARIDEALR